MYIYFLLIRIAALLGHKKARLLARGQADSLRQVTESRDPNSTGKHLGERPIWFHAASVGEFEQARPIIERIRREHPDWPILLTFFSPSGYEMRKGYDQVDLVTYLPFATRRRSRAFIQAVQPRMAIFVKYEFWPAYLRELRKQDIPTYLISAIFRREQTFFRPWGKPYRRLLDCFTRMFVQDEASASLLAEFGFSRTTIAGDTRFDRVTEIHRSVQPIRTIEMFMSAFNICTVNREPLKTIVAGSTWPEDELLLERYVRTHENVRLILVPHEIHEEHLHNIFCRFDGRLVRYTEATPTNMSHVRTLLVDTMGLLSRIYQYADVAYVGGGFGAGIHNTIEAAVYGIPVIFGPNCHKFREAQGLIESGAGISIHDYETFEAAMDDAFAAQAVKGRQAKEYVESELGATSHICTELGLTTK